MFPLNEVKLFGYLDRDPSYSRVFSIADCARTACMSFNLAITKYYPPKGDSTAVHEETEWHNVVCYGKLAVRAEKLITKYSPLLICGSLENTEWTDREGRHKGTRILAARIVALDKSTLNSDSDFD